MSLLISPLLTLILVKYFLIVFIGMISNRLKATIIGNSLIHADKKGLSTKMSATRGRQPKAAMSGQGRVSEKGIMIILIEAK